MKARMVYALLPVAGGLLILLLAAAGWSYWKSLCGAETAFS